MPISPATAEESALVQEVLDTCKDVDFSKVPKVEHVALLFIRARDGRVDSAAERLKNFRNLVVEYELSFALTPEITKAIGLGVLSPTRVVDALGHPILVVQPGKLDWSKVEVPHMQKCWFFVMWNFINMTDAAQKIGVKLINWAKDIGPSLIRIPFQKFILRAISHCLPMRINAVYIVDQPWFFNTMSALLFSGMSSKLKSRIHKLGDEYDKIEAPPEAIPLGLNNGKFQFDVMTYLQEIALSD
jgi:hypothetical protein